MNVVAELSRAHKGGDWGGAVGVEELHGLTSLGPKLTLL